MSNYENNMLIAKFMGATLSKHPQLNNVTVWVSEDFWALNNQLNFKYNLKFDTDWNWLMEVVDKIKRLDVAVQLISNKNCCIHNFGQGYDYNFNYQFEKDFTPVYKAIINFIQWHNENNK